MLEICEVFFVCVKKQKDLLAPYTNELLSMMEGFHK